MAECDVDEFVVAVAFVVDFVVKTVAVVVILAGTMVTGQTKASSPNALKAKRASPC